MFWLAPILGAAIAGASYSVLLGEAEPKAARAAAAR
jgi:hypothetical protein